MPLQSRKRRSVHRRRTRKRPTPCALADDFYGVHNAAWRAATSIPATESRVTRAYYISEEVYREIDEVLADAEGPLKTLQESWDATASAEIPTGISPILLMLLNTTTREELSGHIGWLNRHGLPAPLAVYVQSDPRENSRCRIAIEESYPVIGNTDYWSYPRYRAHRRAYATFVDRLADAVALPALRQGLAVEREYSNDLYPVAGEKKKVDMITLRELQDEYGDIDWVTLLTAAGVPPEHQTRVLYNVSSRPFLHRLNRRFVTWTPARWGAWLALLATQGFAGSTPAGPLRSAWFAYKRRFLQGIAVDLAPAQLRRAILRYLMPDTVSRLWVRDHCDPALRRVMRTMTENIRAAGLSALATTEWMAPSTRRAAREKLRRLDIQVCWPDPWPVVGKETLLPSELSPTDYIGNILALGAATSRWSMRFLDRPEGCAATPEDGWGEAAFQANAFYYPGRNRFLLPAGILRAPFYDPAASLPTNYGAIGATIGHELCHAFDSEGRMYDAEGNTRSWWTPRDTRDYTRRAQSMVQLFESVRYRGMRVNGEMTLTENIADLAGLEFALAGLGRALGRQATDAEIREFFVSYAVSWRSKDRLRRAAQLLDTDYHAPPMLRVNQIVRQFDAWYRAFGVGPDCKGYIPPEKRVHFFSNEPAKR